MNLTNHDIPIYKRKTKKREEKKLVFQLKMQSASYHYFNNRAMYKKHTKLSDLAAIGEGKNTEGLG